MNLHEYQGKELFARFGIPVLPGQVAATPEEARDIAAPIGGTVVIKAQVQAGGRGKAGGVKLAHTPDEAFEKARDILALTIKGLPVRKVLVAQAADIARELYLRDRARPREEAAADHALGRGRRRHRGGRADGAREDRPPPHPARPGSGPTRRARCSSRCSATASWWRRRPTSCSSCGARLPRRRLLAGRDQPAGGHAATARCWRSTPR